MTQYLYGAAVQGIQSFIFQTNKLREIVGASELVEEICTSKFEEIVGRKCDKDNPNAIRYAGGNIIYMFDSEEECKNVVRFAPQIIKEFAPGVTFSQAVVKMEDKFLNFSDAANELDKLLKIQRNKPMRSQTLGLMGIKRSPQSGLSLVEYDVDIVQEKINKIIDSKITQKLCQKAFGADNISHDVICHNIEDMTRQNDWIAVIHADGNALGTVVQKVTKNAELYKKFSEQLNEATVKSAQNAYSYVVKHCDYKWKQRIPIRPIVLGGDDFTVICRADLALYYINVFIKEFEKNTGSKELQNVYKAANINLSHLTACAGIAYVKSSFPFYYGYNLAEDLCSKAKRDAKDKNTLISGQQPQSCVMFHKVQDSFVESFDDITERELSPSDKISFKFGPYYVSDQWKKFYNAAKHNWTVEQLLNCSIKLNTKEGNAVKSHLRQWMSLLHDNTEMAEQKLERLKSITSPSLSEVVNTLTSKGEEGKDCIYPVYDVLTIHTINNQVTKEVEDED